MKKPILKMKDLKALGFQSLGKEYMDNDEFFRWWKLTKNDSEINVTYEFKSNGDFDVGYVELNGEKLKGRELTIEDFKILIEIM